MKKIAIVLCLILFAGNVNADDYTERKTIEYKCVSPCDLLIGFGCYLKDTTCRVGDGIGAVLTAPLKAKACFPEPKRYRYTMYKFKILWSPPKFERIK